MRLVVVGGEEVRAERLARWRQVAGQQVRWINTYGPTEATITATLYEPGEPSRQIPEHIISIGRPIANVQVYVLDAHQQPVPIGVPGELYLGGAGVARGYLKRPELIAERFLPDPFSDQPGARLYRTGDRVRYRADGNLEFLGRVDDQVKLRGYRIEPGEIVATLHQHPAVRDCVVVERIDPAGEKRLVAYLVWHPGTAATAVELRNHLEQRLPEYMVPSVFVPLTALPLNTSGKIDKRALPEPDWSSRAHTAGAFDAPRTPLERALAESWADVLGIAEVGRHDDFFALGGHSLLATQLVFQLQKALQVEVSVRLLFEAPTVAGMAEMIEADRGPDAVAALQRARAAAIRADAVLDPSISAEGVPLAVVAEPEHVLLTGVTGFLGAFLLSELVRQTKATVHCLVRAEDTTAAWAKLKRHLEPYALWNERLRERIEVVIGDLSLPLLGLSATDFESLASTLHVIYHSGAEVNFVRPYRALRAANVLGTQEILRLACRTRVKPVHYVSTLSVFDSMRGPNAAGPLLEDEELDGQLERLTTGYAQSKWAAERLVTVAHSRGVPVAIYRPGLITGHSQTGVWNTEDFLSRAIKGCIQLGSIPDTDEAIEFTPVDHVSTAIVHLAQRPDALGRNFHLSNPSSLSLAKMAQTLRMRGYALRGLSYQQWRDELLAAVTTSTDNPLYPLVPLLVGDDQVASQVTQTSREIDCRNTLAGLSGTGIVCPPADAKLFNRSLSYLVRSGFLEAPAPRQTDGTPEPLTLAELAQETATGGTVVDGPLPAPVKHQRGH